MKTKELVTKLQEADPGGEAECVVKGADIYWLEKLPMYYDGCPNILIKDENISYYNIKGFRSSCTGEKVVLHLMHAEDIIETDPDCIVELDEYSERHKGSWIKHLREMYRKDYETE